jgi:hypothetical protein
MQASQVEGQGHQQELGVYARQTTTIKPTHSAVFFERPENGFDQAFASFI